MRSINGAALRKLIYMIIYIVASVPIACPYIMEGGNMLIWLARIEEAKEALMAGKIMLFPSAELTVAYGAQVSALHTNLWLFFPLLVRAMGGTITTAYRIYMLALNMVALFAARKMFEQVFEDKNTAVIGVLLYMTCPYKVYICYDKASLGLVAAWAFIPLAIAGVIQVSKEKTRWTTILWTGAALAAVGYADGILFMMTVGVGVIWLLRYRNIKIVLPLMLGGILFLPGAVYMIRYLLKGGMEVWGLPLNTIASRGYVTGQIFSCWSYLTDYPGLGLGLLMALMTLLWLWFVEGKMQIMKKYGCFVMVFVLFLFMSMQSFPWDMVQRVGMPFLRIVSLMETPGVCFGFVSLAASVLGAYGLECAMKQQKVFVKAGIPIMVGIAAIGVSVYMCNMLVYNRLPMFLMDTL